MKNVRLYVRDNCLYMHYATVRFPTPSMVVFR